MVLYLDLPCTSFHYGTSVSKHNIFTLCCFAAELNALFPTAGALASKYSVQYLDYSFFFFFFNFILSVSVLNRSIQKGAPFSFVHRCRQLERKHCKQWTFSFTATSLVARKAEDASGKCMLLLHLQGRLPFSRRAGARGGCIPRLLKSCPVHTHWSCCWGSVVQRTLSSENKIKSADAMRNLFHVQKLGECYFWLSGMLTYVYCLDLFFFFQHCILFCLMSFSLTRSKF